MLRLGDVRSLSHSVYTYSFYQQLLDESNFLSGFFCSVLSEKSCLQVTIMGTEIKNDGNRHMSV